MNDFLTHTKYTLRQNPLSAGALVFFLLIALVGLVGPWIVPYDPYASDTANALLKPSWPTGSARTTSAGTSSAGSWSPRGWTC